MRDLEIVVCSLSEQSEDSRSYLRAGFLYGDTVKFAHSIEEGRRVGILEYTPEEYPVTHIGVESHVAGVMGLAQTDESKNAGIVVSAKEVQIQAFETDEPAETSPKYRRTSKKSINEPVEPDEKANRYFNNVVDLLSGSNLYPVFDKKLLNAVLGKSESQQELLPKDLAERSRHAFLALELTRRVLPNLMKVGSETLKEARTTTRDSVVPFRGVVTGSTEKLRRNGHFINSQRGVDEVFYENVAPRLQYLREQFQYTKYRDLLMEEYADSPRPVFEAIGALLVPGVTTVSWAASLTALGALNLGHAAHARREQVKRIEQLKDEDILFLHDLEAICEQKASS